MVGFLIKVLAFVKYVFHLLLFSFIFLLARWLKFYLLVAHEVLCSSSQLINYEIWPLSLNDIGCLNI